MAATRLIAPLLPAAPNPNAQDIPPAVLERGEGAEIVGALWLNGALISRRTVRLATASG